MKQIQNIYVSFQLF